MLKYFLGSYLVTAAGLIGAFLWGEHVHPGSGLQCAFIALVLGILEVSLSFDNAVVNAMKLEKMSETWRHRFITWGIAIAVFGMRFLFPILVVAIFAKLSMLEVFKIATTNAEQYAHYLHLTHAPIVTFGGLFLVMLFLNYFFNHEKIVHWIKFIELPLSHLDHLKGIEIVIALFMLLATQTFVPDEQKVSVLIAGISGIITYLLIEGFTHFLEKHEEMRAAANTGKSLACTGLISFIYLELIDASFSLDGVLGAFALSKDIIIITIGLSIGAMFVRSLTILLVEKKTLAQFLYLEHGAHWAIGALACLMLVSTVKEVPEVITGLIGLGFIVAAFISSVVHNKRRANLIAENEGNENA
ncbi:MAG: DUF475 domain-containing protein [Candidatus Gastranaerophilaceae bacterium]|nr:DUF475 domain-containing protein [Candidatus Gastranaerophilaceae bacterium]